MSDKKGTLAATLDGFIEAVNKTQGISIKELGVGIEINVKTQDNSEFFIFIMNPGEGRVRVKGSAPFVVDPTECVLSGSTWGGSAIKSRWIGIGMYLEFFKDGRQITINSPVRLIGLVMPKPPSEAAN